MFLIGCIIFVKLRTHCLCDVNLFSADNKRVKLIKPHGISDYINAIHIHCYLEQQGVIATQVPLSSTVEDFWLMILQNNVSEIVMLYSLDEEGENFIEFWSEDLTMQNGLKLCTDTESIHIHKDIIVKTITVSSNEVLMFCFLL